MVIATTFNGTELLDYRPGADPSALTDGIPVTFATVIVQSVEGYLFLYNFNRDQWEIPGGGLEPGESLEDCAVRELWEESSQVAESLHPIGYIRVRLVKHGEREEYGAVYGATIGAVQPFVPSAECSRMMLWDGTAPLDGELGTFSRAVLAWYASRPGG